MRKFLLFFLITCLLIFIGCIPTILSTDTGKQLFIDRILQPWILGPQGYHINLTKLKLSWFGPQRVEDLSLVSQKNSLKFSAESASSPASLFRFIFASKKLVPTEILGVHIEDPSSGFQISNASLHITPATEEAPGQIDLLGQSAEQNGEREHPFQLKLILPKERSVSDFIQDMQTLQQIELQGTALPVGLVDIFLTAHDFSARGLLTEAVGPTVDFSMQQSKGGTAVSLKSLHVQGSLLVKTNHDRLQLQEPGNITWNIPRKFSQEFNQYLQWENFLPVAQEGVISLNILALDVSFDTRQWKMEGALKSNLPGGVISKIVGREANGTFQASQFSYTPEAVISLSSDVLKTERMHFLLKKKISLIEPANIQFRVLPALMPYFISNVVPITIHAKTIELASMHNLHVLADIHSEDPVMFSVPKVGQLRVSRFLATIEGNLFHEFHLRAVGEASSTSSSSLLQKITSQNMGLIAEADIALTKIPHYLIQLTHPHGDLRFTGKIMNDTLFATGKVHYRLDDAEWNRLGFVHEGLPYPQGITQCEMSLSELEFPLAEKETRWVRGRGVLEIDSIAIQDQENVLARISHIELPWNIDAHSNTISTSLSAQTYDACSKKAGKISSDSEIANWYENGGVQFEKIIIDSKTQVSKIPISCVEALLQQKHWQELFGPTVDINVSTHIDLARKDQGTIALAFSGHQWDIQGNFRVGNTIALADPHQPMIIHWTVTPERFQAFREILADPTYRSMDRLRLNKAAQVDMKIPNFSLPWLSQESGRRVLHPYLGITHLAATLDVSLRDLSITDIHNKRSTHIDQVNMQFSTRNLIQEIALTVSSPEKNRGKEEIFFQLKGLLENPLTEEGDFNHGNFSLSLSSDARNIPVGLFCDVVLLSDQVMDQMDALIGSHLDNHIDILIKQGKGTIQANLTGTLGSLNLKGKVESGLLTLLAPFTASLQVTPQLGKSVLQPLIPLLSTAYHSERPVTITIAPQGFRFPLLPWDPSLIRIETGVIDLGKINFHYGKQLEEILSILNFSRQKGEDILVWFTPLYFSLKESVAECQRIDMLIANLFHIALWGKVDFANDKVRLTVGLSGRALKNAFGVKGVPDGALLQLPLRGTTGNAQIDKSKSAARVASLIAHAHGGPEGLIIGGLVDILTGAVGDKKLPKPTTSPLPWDEGKTETNGNTEEEMPKSENLIEKGAKEIFKFIKKKL